MNIFPAKIPWFVKKMFPNYVWDIKTTDKVLYLTFDDGPTPDITAWTINTLKTFNAKATFFCIGENINNHPVLFQNIIKDGHAIGNHTQNHLNGWKHNVNDYVYNVALAEQAIALKTKNLNGEGSESNLKESSVSNNNKLFRPPYGRISSKQGSTLRKLGYKIIMWDVVSFDWEDGITQEQCYNNVISKATNGSIIVFHDSVKASKNMQYALPKVLKYFSEKGYEFKKLQF